MPSMPQPTASPAAMYAPASNTRFFRCCPVTSSTTLSAARISASCRPEYLVMNPTVTSNKPWVR